MEVAIVGSNPLTRSDAPYDNPNVDIWVFNEAAHSDELGDDGLPDRWAKRVSAVFQLHTPVVYRNPENRSDTRHWAWLQEPHDFPIYMQAVDPLVPASREYPLERVCNLLLSDFRVYNSPVKYFTSTMAYAFALAIAESWKYDKIHVYGIEMASGTEYEMQKDCLAFWTGLALGKGIPVEWHCGKYVWLHKLYGYESDVSQHSSTFLARREEVLQKLPDIRKAEQEAMYAFAEACDQGGDIGLMKDTLQAWLNVSVDLGHVEGVLSTVDYYLFKIEQMEKTTGSAMIDRSEFEGNASAETQLMYERDKAVSRVMGTLDYIFHVYLHLRQPGALDQIRKFGRVYRDHGYEHGHAKGKAYENNRLLIALDESLRAAGGTKAVPALVGEQHP